MSVYSQARLSPDRPSLALPCNALAELVIFLRLAKDTTIKAGCWESYCSEGLGAQGTGKCVVVVHSKGTIACSQ